METLTACLVAGPYDGALLKIGRSMFSLRVVNKRQHFLTLRDIEDLTDKVPTDFNEGEYVRGRTGQDVTFYVWNGWKW